MYKIKLTILIIINTPIRANIHQFSFIALKILSSSGVISAVSTPADGLLATLPYTHLQVIDQPFATTTRNAAGMFWNFQGDITLSPDQDFWVDTTTAAEVQLNFPRQQLFFGFSKINIGHVTAYFVAELAIED